MELREAGVKGGGCPKAPHDSSAERPSNRRRPGSNRGSATGGGDGRKQQSRVMYILDEPTTGLHFDDVSKLLTAFRKLIDGGGSLVEAVPTKLPSTKT